MTAKNPRCHAKNRFGEQCKLSSVTGLTVCMRHGGGTKLAKAKSERAKIVKKMHAFVTPIAADDPETDPITSFEIEFRRTIGRIRWYDEQLAKLHVEELTWGRTKEEHVGAGEFVGVNVTNEAQANTLHELQFRERQHLVNMQKIWISAKLDETKLNIQGAYVRALEGAIVQILTALGHDPGDPGVRQVVRDRLLALPTRSV